MGLDRNLTLIGFMGTGKTSVGKALAKRLGAPLVDLDRWIEGREGRTIRDIFMRDGEPKFRELEREAIREITARSGLVITTGGGAVLDPENRRRLRESGWVVSLACSPETILKRVSRSKHRPLLNVKDKRAEICRLLEIRKPFYEDADFRFETDACSPGFVAERILKALGLRGEEPGR